MITVPKKNTIAFMSGVAFAIALGVGLVLFGTSGLAGSLTPPGSPANTMYTLTDLYNLASGTTTSEGSGGLPATPGTATGTMYTLTEVYNALNTEKAKVTAANLVSGVTAFGATGTVYRAAPLKTGEATCWDAAGSSISCASTGQDGELQKGIAFSYIDNGNGTISDKSTGLMWQKVVSGTYTWQNALNYCNYNTPGLPGTGWRLPNVKELYTLLNFTVNQISKINLTYFPGTPASYFWSATTLPYTGAQSLAMYVYFSDGLTYVDYKTNSYYVRCVRDN